MLCITVNESGSMELREGTSIPIGGLPVSKVDFLALVIGVNPSTVEYVEWVAKKAPSLSKLTNWSMKASNAK